MSDELRYGVIGTGMMGCEHIRNINAQPGARVVAISDPVEASRAWGIDAADGPVEVYEDHAAMLAAERLDAVVVASPNHTHHDVLDAVWEHGTNVLIEKPLCTTVPDCLDVVARAADHPGVVWMGLEYRYMPPVRLFLDSLADGAAGRVRMLTIREHRFPFLEKVGDWNRFSRNTGGTLVEKCCHFFDLMNLALGERPVRVLASGAQDVNHLDERYDGETPDILDNAFVVVDYPSGARALLDLCMFAEGSRWEQELTAVGDAGKVEVHLPNFMEGHRGRVAEIVVGSRAGDWPVTEQPVDDDPRVRYTGAHHGASYLELVDFSTAIRQGTAPGVTLQDGLWSVAMGAAAHRSIDEGRPVELAEFGLTAG